MIRKVLKAIVVLLIAYFVSCVTCLYNPWRTISAKWPAANPPFPSQSFDNLFWFVQISDIHISLYRDLNRGSDLKDFCTATLNTIQPELVLVTGDLTDAKDKTRFRSKQYEQEWISYQNVIKNSKVAQKYKWIDIRGNHDAFDVMATSSQNNYYAKYSGDKGKLSKSTFKLSKSFGNYSFIPVDAALTPGPRRPFNFMGYLSKKDLDFLHKEGEKSLSSNFTFWYGHFPSSVISTASYMGLRNIIGKFGYVYLNGHLHDLERLAPIQYALHSNGFLELEVKDWMENRFYRILAVDHDLLSFIDVKHNDWPVILITNPKPATFMIPKHEPISRIRNSTHIRFLVFSPFQIEKITVSINDVSLDEPKHVQGPLWVSRWNPLLYMEGMHHLVVDVTDKEGRRKIQRSEFSLDDEWKTEFALMGLFLILTDLCTFFHVLFIFLSVIPSAIMVVVKRNRVKKSNKFLFKLQLLLCDDVTFYVILVFHLNLLLGPLFVGELLTNHVGVGFSFGLFFDGKFVIEHTLYVFCILQILLSYLPAVYYLTHVADIRWATQSSFRESFVFSRRNIIANSLFLLHLFQLYRSFRSLFMSYGWLTLVFSPAYSWWLLATFYLVVRTWTRSINVR